MHNRVLSWLFFCVFVAAVSVRAQAPAPAVPSSPPPGLVLVAQVTGSVTKTLNGVRTALKVNDRIEQTAKINTALDSSVVLAFSNGATTQLGADTELVIDQFLQDPFERTLVMANLEEEPTQSITKLSLNRGELIGKVAKLKRTSGSSFTVQTPVGAAGIRGTTFRIVFRPQGTGLAFFSLSTVEGDVNFTQPGQGGTTTPGAGGTPGTPPADPNAPGGGTPPPGGGTGTGGGVAVTGGQEVVITVNVSVNATTGVMTVTAPPTVVTTVPISSQTQAAIVQQAQSIAVAVATTCFTAAPPASSGTGGGTTPGGGTAESQGPSGSTTGSSTATNPPASTPAATNPPASTPVATNPPASTPPATNPPANKPPATNPPPPPPPPPTPPRTTSGDGRPGG